jgi:hypothetical protein
MTQKIDGGLLLFARNASKIADWGGFCPGGKKDSREPRVRLHLCGFGVVVDTGRQRARD